MCLLVSISLRVCLCVYIYVYIHTTWRNRWAQQKILEGPVHTPFEIPNIFHSDSIQIPKLFPSRVRSHWDYIQIPFRFQKLFPNLSDSVQIFRPWKPTHVLQQEVILCGDGAATELEPTKRASCAPNSNVTELSRSKLCDFPSCTVCFTAALRQNWNISKDDQSNSDSIHIPFSFLSYSAQRSIRLQ